MTLIWEISADHNTEMSIYMSYEILQVNTARTTIGTTTHWLFQGIISEFLGYMIGFHFICQSSSEQDSDGNFNSDFYIQ